jgi:capsular exopolysaccharide synthesis family protein
LSNILIGARRLEDLTAKTQLSNLDVLPSGSAPPNPTEQLGSPMMRQLIEAAVGNYDQVIIDAPPVLLASDASVLATMVNGVILVLRAKGNSRGVAQRAISLLTHVNAHLFGAVLNAAQVQRGGYFREQLRTFYEYQTEEALADRRSTAALPPRAPDAAIDDGTGSPRESDPDRP